MTKTESYISFIIEQLQKGNVERGKVLSIFGKKWQTSDRTFDRAWKKAQQRYKEAQILIQKEKADLYKESEIKQKKADILQKEQVEKMMSDVVKLAYNNVVQSKGKDKEVYAFSSAIANYNKMQGFDAPNKTELTGKDGKNIMPDKFRIIIKKKD